MALALSENIHLTPPDRGDGPAMQRIARDTGVLSVNSGYYYALMARLFRRTCLVARYQDQIYGYITGFFPPDRWDSLFVWQIGVAPEAQGRGLGKRMLIALAKQARPAFIEATIDPENAASIKTFAAAARHLGADWVFADRPYVDQRDLGPGQPPEHLMRIGPIFPAPPGQETP
jgi:L-2,4-diaminobutyric acid acetyltransferase